MKKAKNIKKVKKTLSKNKKTLVTAGVCTGAAAIGVGIIAAIKGNKKKAS